MKLNNFSSLDPKEHARGIRGLTGTSRLDREIWSEFHQSSEKVAIESELLWTRHVDHLSVFSLPVDQVTYSDSANGDTDALQDGWTGATESPKLIATRLAQGFFRRTVLAAYRGRCCISQNPLKELLVASHILPWAAYPEHRTNPHNGLLLSRLHDGAFDRGLIAFDEDYRLLLSKRIKECLTIESIRSNFAIHEGRRIEFPEKFIPDKSFISHHRETIFEKRINMEIETNIFQDSHWSG